MTVQSSPIQASGELDLSGDMASRVIVVQPVVPSYRLGFFDRIYQRLGRRLSVHASAEGSNALRGSAFNAAWQRTLGPITRLVPGLYWQRGALSIPIRKGDIVFVCGAPRCLSNLALFIKARLKGATGVWWGHYWSHSSKGWRAAIRIGLMRLAHHLMFYTDKEVGEFQQQAGNPDGVLVFALNNGLETREIKMLRSPYVGGKREDRILFVGRLREGTGLETLFRALADPRCARIVLDIIGGGEHERELRRVTETAGVADRIKWHGACTDERVISEIANRCKLFVYPGAVGLSLIHGLSYGLPSIVHGDRWKHGPEFAALEPGRNGFLFERGDASSLADVIVEAVADDRRLAAMSACAVSTTEGDFNCQAMTDRFFDALSAIDRHKPQRVAS